MSGLYTLAPVFYFLLYYIIGYRKEVVFGNLQNAFPDKSPPAIKMIAKRFYRNYSEVLVEMIKSISIDKEVLARQVRFDNAHILEGFLERNQSVIVMLAHHCNIDWLLLACDIKLNHPMDAVYKPLHDKSMDQLMLETRSRFGAKPIPARNTIMEIMRRKNETRCFAIVPDQTPRNEDEKFWTRFLNQDTAFFLGVEKIARMTRYPVLFMEVKRSRRGHYNAHFQVLATPPYSGDENNITQRYARAVEAQILEAPADWLWSHRRWKHKKPLYA
ncbi:MAG: lysophospholipid acyltransferase family protein [Gammaproteobacteria bacterium]|nr:lysophospholipid acyltransferase family protein [Gammaproteobacteria bacterium]